LTRTTPTSSDRIIICDDVTSEDTRLTVPLLSSARLQLVGIKILSTYKPMCHYTVFSLGVGRLSKIPFPVRPVCRRHLFTQNNLAVLQKYHVCGICCCTITDDSA
jgi:hypothetical protein